MPKRILAVRTENEFEFFLPVGNISISVDIYDYWDAVREFEFSYIYEVNVPSSISFQETLDEISVVAGIKDQTLWSMKISSICSVRDSIKWDIEDLSYNGTVWNDHDSKILENITAMNRQMLNLSSTMFTVDTLNSLELAAVNIDNILEGIYTTDYGVFTIDRIARTQVKSFTRKILNAVKNIEVSSPKKLISLGSSVMNIIGKILIGMNKIIGSKKIPPTDIDAAVDWEYDTDLNTDTELIVNEDKKVLQYENALEITKVEYSEFSNDLTAIVHEISNVLKSDLIEDDKIRCSAPTGGELYLHKMSAETFEKGFSTNLGNAKVSFPEGFNVNSSSITLKTNVIPAITEASSESAKKLTRETYTVSVEIEENNENNNVDNEGIRQEDSSSNRLFNSWNRYQLRSNIDNNNQIDVTVPKRMLDSKSTSVIGNKTLESSVPIIYHAFNISQGSSSYHLELTPISKAIPNGLTVIIHQNRYPTLSNYLEKASFSDFLSSNDNKSFSYNFKSKFTEKQKTNLIFGLFVMKELDQTKYGHLNLNKRNQIIHIGNFDFDYEVKIVSSGCLCYDKYKKEWSSDGIEVVKATSTETVCRSRHIGDIATMYANEKIEIDFKFIYENYGFEDNMTIYITFIISCLTYFSLLVLTTIKDNQETKTLEIIPLQDNKFSDKYLYEISFYTGPDKEAATESNINFQLVGSNGSSQSRNLPRGNKDLFSRYSVNSFVLSMNSSLGTILKLRVFHDNTGFPPYDSWQLMLVVIRDLQTGIKTAFFTNYWLSLDRENSSIDVTFLPTNNHSETALLDKLIVNNKLNINHNHMWLSIFFKPHGSRYSRKQRLTVAFVYINLTMLISALYNNFTPDAPVNSFLEISPFVVSYEELIIGIGSSIIAMPFAMFIGLVFSRCKPRRLLKSRAVKAINKQFSKKMESDECEFISTKSVPENSDNYKKTKDKRNEILLPWWMRYITWIFCCAFILGSYIYIWKIGISWGETKTSKWFSAYITSFILSIILQEWIKVGILSFCTVCKEKDFTTLDVDCDEEFPNLENENNVKSCSSSQNNYKSYHAFENDNHLIKTQKPKAVKVREMSDIVRDIMKYFLFLTILYLMSFGHTSYNGYLLKTSLTNLLVKEPKFFKVNFYQNKK